MKNLLFYLIQVIITSGILYGYYHWMLRNKKFHQYNRFYLLSAAMISILIPFLNIPVYFAPSEIRDSAVLQTLQSISMSGTVNEVTVNPVAQALSVHFSWNAVLFILYLLAAGLFLVRILISLKKIRAIIKNNPVEEMEGVYVINTFEPGTPYSFFRWLFWNRRIELRSERGEQIFRHEIFHIQQRHSLDILLLEILAAFLWINPFFHLMKKEIKAIHEFLADRFAAHKTEKWKYAELLLMQALGTQQHLVNPFFHNQIRRRIAMITNSQKTSYRYLRKLLVLPVAAMVVVLFAFSYNKKNLQDDSFSPPLSEFDRAGKIDTIGPGSGSREINATVKITKRDSLNTNQPVSIVVNGKEFLVKQLKIEGLEGSKGDTMELNVSNEYIGSLDSTEKPLIIVDGIKQKSISALQNIDPGIIESITVYKGPTAIAKYGIEGKNGAIEILTNPKKMPANQEIQLEEKRPDKDNNMVFEKVEVEPAFPGGIPAWEKFLKGNLDVTIPVKNNAPSGAYTVFVQFIVRKDGSISNIKPLTNHGFGMEQEAIRIIKIGPAWIPAIQNGRKVNAYRKERIDFPVENSRSGSLFNKTNTSALVTPEFAMQRRQEIDEIKAIAKITEDVAYVHRGRTYLFANKEATNFSEQDGIGHSFLLNGELVTSVAGVNNHIKRKDVKQLSLISGANARHRYNVEGSIISIETF